MAKKNETPNPNERLKVEAAMELGLFEKAQLLGWDKLTAQETGKIGALVKKMLKRNINQTTD
ncbi:MAG: small, acid-soluble spore protein, alpha/beta type [Tepidanaerobacteraceae bacterium]|nr:small, acid-soluble spore protein, alpha/beta type [Tepidanaerobacteraceae bacterium]